MSGYTFLPPPSSKIFSVCPPTNLCVAITLISLKSHPVLLHIHDKDCSYAESKFGDPSEVWGFSVKVGNLV